MKLFQRTAKDGNELGDLLEPEKKPRKAASERADGKDLLPGIGASLLGVAAAAPCSGSASSAAPVRRSSASWTRPGPKARPAPCARPCSNSPPTPAPPRPAPRPRSPAKRRRHPHRGRPAQPAGLGRRGRCPPERARPGRPGQRQPRPGQLRRPRYPAPGGKWPERRRRSLQGRPALAAVQRRAGARRRPEPARHAAAGGRPATAARPAALAGRCRPGTTGPAVLRRTGPGAAATRYAGAGQGRKRWTAAIRTGN